MSDVLPLTRNRPHGQAVYVRYEQAGLVLYGLPIPWNADAVIVEALLQLPPVARHKSLFTLRLPGREPIAPETFRLEADDRHRLLFRLPAPGASSSCELLWKHRLLSTVAIPMLSAEDFLANLRMTLPTVAVRLGSRTVAAQTFVASQCKGLLASCVVKSPTALAPLADLGFKAVFRSERNGLEYAVPVSLSSSQLSVKEAVVTASPPKIPHRVGVWSVSWQVAGREFAHQQVQGIPARRFEQSLRVSDTRFAVADKAGRVTLTRQPPPAGSAAQLGPCFLVASSEPGMAGICKLQILAPRTLEGRSNVLMENEVLVTDGPTAFTAGLLAAEDAERIAAFELRHKGRLLGVASLSPVPNAELTSEGGFKPPPDFTWTNAADDELSERISRLMNGEP